MGSVGVIILLGPPGSGKGTQAKILAQKNPSWVHISTGDLFRREIASNSTLGTSLKGILAAGQLVSDETTNQVFQSQVKAILDKNPQVSALLLDGYPRTAAQVDALFSFCRSEGRLKSPISVELDVDEEVLVERLSGRLTNPRTGRIYHKTSNPPKVAGICDDDGGPLVQRSDDQADVIRSRFKVYTGQKDGILNALKKGEAPMFKVQGDGELGEITTKLEKAILKSEKVAHKNLS